MKSDLLKAAWEKKEDAVILTTVDAQGVPNSIYATCVNLSDDGRIVVADNYFTKTKKNIERVHTVSVLFITTEGKSYQVKGDFEYKTDGPLYSWMKEWNPTKHPGHGALVINPKEIYSGAEKLL